MLKISNLKLKRVVYTGKSIGRDVRIEIGILGKSFNLERRIKVGENNEIDQILGALEFDDSMPETDIAIKVIEKDSLFSDSGEIKGLIDINTVGEEPKLSSFKIKVNERRSWWMFWLKREATFQIELETQPVIIDIEVKKYSYKGVDGNEDYNKHDDLIKNTVDYWNDQFSKDTDPPSELLDPNLVKAILYQESRVGNDKLAGVNIMQVGNPGDPSIRTLRGELKEYWIHDGEQILLKYDAQVGTEDDSVMWGVRWLYHKAQHINHSGHRYWGTWKEAVKSYGPPKKDYAESVWGIYKDGLKKEKDTTLKLWSHIVAIPLLCLFLFGQQTPDLKSAIINFFDSGTRLQIQDVDITYDIANPSLFAAIIEEEKDWFEQLAVGLWDGAKIKWIRLGSVPDEISIRSARFVHLQGFENSLLEVYGQTHMGYGALHLFEVDGEKAHQIFETAAVDIQNDSIWSKENEEKYGYSTCGETYNLGQLTASYSDLNNDGIDDLTLSGKINVDCEKLLGLKDGYMTYEDVRVDQYRVQKEFVLKK